MQGSTVFVVHLYFLMHVERKLVKDLKLSMGKSSTNERGK